MSTPTRLRIFIFDDDPAITHLLHIMLSYKGHYVLTFANPRVCPVYNKTACTCPQELPCADVIIADIMMPHMSGIDMLRLQQERGCKILAANKALMSASISKEMQQAATDLGCHFLKKPFRINEVLDWLEECEQRLPAQSRLGEV